MRVRGCEKLGQSISRRRKGLIPRDSRRRRSLSPHFFTAGQAPAKSFLNAWFRGVRRGLAIVLRGAPFQLLPDLVTCIEDGLIEGRSLDSAQVGLEVLEFRGAQYD